MSRLLRTFVALVTLGATGVTIASSWGVPVTITGYYVWDSGTAYFTTSNNQNPDGCSSSHYLSLDTSAAFFKEIYATIMVAQATGQTVTLSYAGCVGAYPHINSVAIPNIW